jgi:transposase InsO family protein
MPWREATAVSERTEFIAFVGQEALTMSALCRRFGVSRKTGYKWLRRAREAGLAGLTDRPRRPLRSPQRTDRDVETFICALREEHPAWGGRKLHHLLRNDGFSTPPAPSTITGILRRNGLLTPERPPPRDWQRFEEASPNGLWQMDFKGPFATAAGRCHALTVLDDHSRFNLCLAACANQQGQTVQAQLTSVMQRYGLPDRMLMDNGPPWGSDAIHQHTWFTAWLIRLGVTVSHGRPFHPQTQGKEERFHRTLALEVLRSRAWQSLADVQCAFDAWRAVYNLRRPHESLGQATPASRYRPSRRPFPAALPPIEYAPGDEVRKVQHMGLIHFRGRELRISRAFIGQPVALRAVADGRWDVYYCHQRIGQVDLTC